MTAEEFLGMVLKIARDDKEKASIFSYIYRRRIERSPERTTTIIQEEMCKEFDISQKTLEKYIYWK